MRYTGSLAKKEREKIFGLFLDKEKLRFSDIEKAIKIRSNMVSYHIDQMLHENLLEKKGEYYYLTNSAEKYIPIFSHITGHDMSPLPVILVAVMFKDKILLIKRNKRPYKGYWSMIGGKILHDENLIEASIRIVKKKVGFESKFISTNAVLHERVSGDGITKHSFILFFTKVYVKDKILKQSIHGDLKWFDPKKISEDIIFSDLWLINNKLHTNIDISNVMMHEKDGILYDFNIN